MPHVLFTSNLKVLDIQDFGMGPTINKDRAPAWVPDLFGFSPYSLKSRVEVLLQGTDEFWGSHICVKSK